MLHYGGGTENVRVKLSLSLCILFNTCREFPNDGQHLNMKWTAFTVLLFKIFRIFVVYLLRVEIVTKGGSGQIGFNE